jgi:hypothetical protein
MTSILCKLCARTVLNNVVRVGDGKRSIIRRNSNYSRAGGAARPIQSHKIHGNLALVLGEPRHSMDVFENGNVLDDFSRDRPAGGK